MMWCIQSIKEICSNLNPKYETFVKESKELLRIGWILSIFMLLEYALTSTSVIFCGHIGTTEMAVAGLAQSILSVCCFMPGYGVVSVCNTYFSGGFQSKDDRRQGIILQKAILLSGLMTLLCWGVLINTENILRLFQQKEDVSILVGVFVRVFLPAVPALFVGFVLSRFLQCRNRAMITMFGMLFTVVINILLNYLFIIVLDGGISWSAGSLTVSLYVYLLIISVYVYMYADLEDICTGWSIESLDDWYEFSAIGLHGCLMFDLEIVAFEAGYFLCGIVGELDVAVFGAVYIMVSYTYMISSGIAMALAIRVGNNLGANEIGQAKTSAQVAFILIWIYGAVVLVILEAFHEYVGFMFTTDREVVEQISSIVPVLIAYQISDLTCNIARGVIQGCGRQSAGALIAFVCYYFFGLPVCVYLVLFCEFGAKGMWIGLCIGVGTQVIGLLIYTFNIDWESEAKRCQERNRDHSEHTQVAEMTAEYNSKSRPTVSRDTEESIGTSRNTTEEGNEKLELIPLVGKSKGFRLSRETMYMRIINVSVSVIFCLTGVTYYILSL